MRVFLYYVYHITCVPRLRVYTGVVGRKWTAPEMCAALPSWIGAVAKESTHILYVMFIVRARIRRGWHDLKLICVAFCSHLTQIHAYIQCFCLKVINKFADDRTCRMGVIVVGTYCWCCCWWVCWLARLATQGQPSSSLGVSYRINIIP